MVRHSTFQVFSDVNTKTVGGYSESAASSSAVTSDRNAGSTKVKGSVSAHVKTDKVENVMGSCAGAGSSEFHLYLNARKREHTRLETIEQEEKREREERLQREKLERIKLETEQRERKNNAKRNRKKEMKLKKRKFAKLGANGKGGVSGDDGEGDESDDESVTPDGVVDTESAAASEDVSGEKEATGEEVIVKSKQQ